MERDPRTKKTIVAIASSSRAEIMNTVRLSAALRALERCEMMDPAILLC